MRNQNKTLYAIVYVGLMAAMIYVVTMFVKIDIPMQPPAMLKAGNILCLLAGMLFGGWYGGLAAGIGSFLFDLSNPNYAPEAGFTLVFFFLMAGVCGWLSHLRGANGENTKLNILGASTGAVLYFVLNIGKNIVKLMIAGSAFGPAFITNLPRMATSGVNAAIAIVCSVLLAKPLHKALRAAGVLEKIGH